MKNIVIIMRNCRRRNWMTIVICIGIGLFMGLIQQFLGKNFNEDFSKMTVVLVRQEDTVFSKSLSEYLEKQLDMQVTISDDYDKYTEDLLDRKLSAIIELNSGYYEQSIQDRKAPSVEITTIDNYANEAYLKSYLNVYLKSMDLIFQSADGNQELADQLIRDVKLPDVNVVGADESVRERSSNYSGFSLTAGFYLNFVWIIGLLLGFTIISDRLEGTFTRIQGTPIKGHQYMLGTALYYTAASLLVPLILIGILKIREVDVGVPYWLIALNFIIMNVFVIGISIICALIVNTKIGVVIGIYTFGAIIAIIGGAYFDLSGVTGSLEKVYRLTPTYWFMNCIRSSQENPNFEPTLSLIILSLSAVLVLLVASVLFNQQKEVKA